MSATLDQDYYVPAYLKISYFYYVFCCWTGNYIAVLLHVCMKQVPSAFLFNLSLILITSFKGFYSLMKLNNSKLIQKQERKKSRVRPLSSLKDFLNLLLENKCHKNWGAEIPRLSPSAPWHLRGLKPCLSWEFSTRKNRVYCQPNAPSRHKSSSQSYTSFCIAKSFSIRQDTSSKV